MEEKTLVVLAAGMGSRFGGLKQIEPVGPNGEFILDYSVYSAIRYGFNKVVFIIKEENLSVFKETIGHHLEDKVPIEYAFQKLEDLPVSIDIPKERVKPWGTAHALYSARDVIHGKFAIINADDFYGDSAFQELSKHMDESDDYIIIGYKVGQTLSGNGAVKRAMLFHDRTFISSVCECSCTRDDKSVKCVPLDTKILPFYIDLDALVSVSLNSFDESFIEAITEELKSLENRKDNLDSVEVLIPDVIDKEIKRGKKVRIYPTDSKWIGMTYKEDKEMVQDFIKEEIKKGVYPEHLWSDEN